MTIRFATWMMLAATAMTVSLPMALADTAKVPDQVRIGIEGAYPPFNYRDAAGNVVGFDVDVMNAICARKKLNCTFVLQDWDGIIPGLLVGKYDVIIGIGITEERKKKVDFTDKYWATASRFVGRADKSWDYTAEGLKGAVIGFQSGAYQETYAKDKFTQSELKGYQTLEQAYLDLAAGRIDLVFAAAIAELNFLNSPDGKGYEHKGPDFDDPDYFGVGVGMAIRQGETGVRDVINEGIREIRADGEYKKINDKYFPFDVYGK